MVTSFKEVGGSEPQPEPSDVKSISEIIKAEDGTYTAEGFVVAVYAQGYLLEDATGKILVFCGKEYDGSLQVGDKVKVTGTTTVYGKAKQFGLGSTYEKSGTTEVKYPEAKEITGAMADAYQDMESLVIEYVKVKGTLAVSGSYYNLTIEGASKVTGSITYPVDVNGLALLDGKVIEAYGYVISVTGKSNQYLNFMVTSFKEVGGSEPQPEPEPQPTTGDLTLDFVKNYGKVSSGWGSGYEQKTITGDKLGVDSNIRVELSCVSAQTTTITDRPVIAAGKKGTDQTVVISGFTGKLKDVTFNLTKWSDSKKFSSIVIEYSIDGTTWTTASAELSGVIADNQVLKTNVDISTAKYIRLSYKTSISSSNQQIGLASIIMNFDK